MSEGIGEGARALRYDGDVVIGLEWVEGLGGGWLTLGGGEGGGTSLRS